MSGNEPTAVAEVVRTTQIVRLALVMGVVSFAGLVAWIKQNRQGPLVPEIPNPLYPNSPLILQIAMFFGATAILASFVVPSVLETNGRKQVAAENLADEGDFDFALAEIAQTSSIVRGALVEGACFLLTISSLIEDHWWGILFLVPLIALHFMTIPTQESVEDWIVGQRYLMRTGR